jgi:WD40 repeat protein
MVSVSSSHFKREEKALVDAISNGTTGLSSDDDLISSKTVDEMVCTLDHNEDSVYSVAWSNGDPWIFAGISFDGTISLNHVPNDYKYKIIL